MTKSVPSSLFGHCDYNPNLVAVEVGALPNWLIIAIFALASLGTVFVDRSMALEAQPASTKFAQGSQMVGGNVLPPPADQGLPKRVFTRRELCNVGNETAQRLYDSTGAERSEWVEYELPLSPSHRDGSGCDA
jgi:hypothetical protein